MMTEVRKRSVMIAGHPTSVTLEAPFWDALKELAAKAINRAMEKEPEDRPTSAAGYIQSIARAAGI